MGAAVSKSVLRPDANVKIVDYLRTVALKRLILRRPLLRRLILLLT